MSNIGRLSRAFLVSVLLSFVVFMSVSVISVCSGVASVFCVSTVSRCIYPSWCAGRRRPCDS